jgi:dihydroxyacetone kinase
MVDAVVPFADHLGQGVAAGRSLTEAWRHAASVTADAAQQTAELAAKVGRARAHGDRSIGTPDPGAVSFALVCTTVADELERAAGAPEPGEGAG